MTRKTAAETRAMYGAQNDNELIALALRAIERRAATIKGNLLTSPDDAKAYFRLRIGESQREIFAVCFLDIKHRLIEYDEMFLGTYSQTSVYPREIMRKGLNLNAAAVLLAHNHPSGELEPSEADLNLTRQLVTALALADIRVLDHFIVTPHGAMSFAERGII